jgi:hypothetical protein
MGELRSSHRLSAGGGGVRRRNFQVRENCPAPNPFGCGGQKKQGFVSCVCSSFVKTPRHNVMAFDVADRATKRLPEVGTIPIAAEFGAYIAAELEKWAKVVKFAGIQSE